MSNGKLQAEIFIAISEHNSELTQFKLKEVRELINIDSFKNHQILMVQKKSEKVNITGIMTEQFISDISKKYQSLLGIETTKNDSMAPTAMTGLHMIIAIELACWSYRCKLYSVFRTSQTTLVNKIVIHSKVKNSLQMKGRRIK